MAKSNFTTIREKPLEGRIMIINHFAFTLYIFKIYTYFFYIIKKKSMYISYMRF